jgi:hypothetical protein
VRAHALGGPEQRPDPAQRGLQPGLHSQPQPAGGRPNTSRNPLGSHLVEAGLHNDPHGLGQTCAGARCANDLLTPWCGHVARAMRGPGADSQPGMQAAGLTAAWCNKWQTRGRGRTFMPLGAAGASAVDSSVRPAPRAAPRADDAVSIVTAAPPFAPPADSSVRRRAAAAGAAAMPAAAPPLAGAAVGVGVEPGPVLFVTGAIPGVGLAAACTPPVALRGGSVARGCDPVCRPVLLLTVGTLTVTASVGAVWAAATTEGALVAAVVGALVAAAAGGVGGGVLAAWAGAAVCALTKATCGCAAACADALTWTHMGRRQEQPRVGPGRMQRRGLCPTMLPTACAWKGGPRHPGSGSMHARWGRCNRTDEAQRVRGAAQERASAAVAVVSERGCDAHRKAGQRRRRRRRSARRRRRRLQ